MCGLRRGTDVVIVVVVVVVVVWTVYAVGLREEIEVNGSRADS